MQYKIAAALLTAVWMNAGIGAQLTTTSQDSANPVQASTKTKAQAKKHGKKRSKIVRSRKNNAAPARDSDADVLAQVIADALLLPTGQSAATCRSGGRRSGVDTHQFVHQRQRKRLGLGM